MSVLVFLNLRILRSAQVNGASLKPAYPGSSTYCTCGYGSCILLISRKVPHLEYCPLHDISDTEIECINCGICLI